MRATFNGTCDRCKQFKPRCALVNLRVDGKATQYHVETTTACPECRKQLHGSYRLDERHKSGS